MPRRTTISPEAGTVEWVPTDYSAPLDPLQIFGRVAPLEIDLGCGDGTYLVALAQQNPERNFLGIDRMPGRLGSACKRISRLKLGNARVVSMETSAAMANGFRTASISAFHLMFPDPWPKRRHHRRRVANATFFAAIALALKRDGSFHVATDHREYFDSIVEAASEFFIALPAQRGPTLTTFEQRFASAGVPVYRASFRKISEFR